MGSPSGKQRKDEFSELPQDEQTEHCRCVFLARHLAFGHIIAFSDLDDIICTLQIKKLMLREVE